MSFAVVSYGSITRITRAQVSGVRWRERARVRGRSCAVVILEISAHKDVKYAALRAVLWAARDSGVPALSLRAGEARGISARIRVSPDVPYRDLARWLDALNKAGVARIQIGAP